MTIAPEEYAIRAWLETVVIGLDLCPFAAKPFRQDGIRFSICRSVDTARGLERLIEECRHLDTDLSINTTLLIYPHSLHEFDDYLDFLSLAETLLSEQGYDGIYQLASFHPDYCFADSDSDDPANYTNRSPYPILHLLREDSISEAIERHPDPENIPRRNIAFVRNLGKSHLHALIASCRQAGIPRE